MVIINNASRKCINIPKKTRKSIFFAFYCDLSVLIRIDMHKSCLLPILSKVFILRSMAERIFSTHATLAFNNWFGTIVRTLGREAHEIMEDDFVALILGGSYGRAEGGIINVDKEERPYHDVDIYPVVLKKNKIVFKRFITISRKYQERLKVPVHIKEPLRERDIHRMGISLEWWDLFHNYIVVGGDETILERNRPKWIDDQPTEETALNLFLHRGVNLLELLWIRSGHSPEPDSDYVKRMYYKVAFSLGDGILIALRRYSATIKEKLPAYIALEDTVTSVKNLDLRGIYEKACDFKLRPASLLKKNIEKADIDELVWKWGSAFLYSENLRLENAWKNLSEYIQYNGEREKNTEGVFKTLKHTYDNFKEGIFSISHPREDVYRELPVLLGLTGESAMGSEWALSTERFLSTWKRLHKHTNA